MVVKLAPPDTRLLITDTEDPVDSQYAEKQQRLLVEPLYSSWAAPDGQPFRANSNVGLFFADDADHPLVPDAMLALGVPQGDIEQPDHRSFFVWIVGKVPDVVIEIVSPKTNGEDGEKLRKYERRGIPNYVVYDPGRYLGSTVLRAFSLVGSKYRRNPKGIFPAVGLGLKLWRGSFEDSSSTWLRWCDLQGDVIPTAQEGRETEKAGRLHEKRRADANEERIRLLEAKLRELGGRP